MAEGHRTMSEGHMYYRRSRLTDNVYNQGRYLWYAEVATLWKTCGKLSLPCGLWILRARLLTGATVTHAFEGPGVYPVERPRQNYATATAASNGRGIGVRKQERSHPTPTRSAKMRTSMRRGWRSIHRATSRALSGRRAQIVIHSPPSRTCNQKDQSLPFAGP